MMTKFSPWLLVSGLLLACPAAATEQAPPQGAPPQSSSLKVAIDPVTGKRRALSVDESHALDAQTRTKAQSMRSATRVRTGGPSYFPATIAESMKNAHTVKGITGFKPTADLMSSLQVTRDASGKLTMQHSDPSQDSSAPAVTPSEELPSE